MLKDKNSQDQSDKIARDGEERCVQHEEDVYLPKKASASSSTIQGCMEVDRSRDRPENPSPEVKTVDCKDLDQIVNDFLQ